jgi:hypothetical protein
VKGEATGQPPQRQQRQQRQQQPRRDTRRKQHNTPAKLRALREQRRQREAQRMARADVLKKYSWRANAWPVLSQGLGADDNIFGDNGSGSGGGGGGDTTAAAAGGRVAAGATSSTPSASASPSARKGGQARGDDTRKTLKAMLDLLHAGKREYQSALRAKAQFEHLVAHDDDDPAQASRLPSTSSSSSPSPSPAVAAAPGMPSETPAPAPDARDSARYRAWRKKLVRGRRAASLLDIVGAEVARRLRVRGYAAPAPALAWSELLRVWPRIAAHWGRLGDSDGAFDELVGPHTLPPPVPAAEDDADDEQDVHESEPSLRNGGADGVHDAAIGITDGDIVSRGAEGGPESGDDEDGMGERFMRRPLGRGGAIGAAAKRAFLPSPAAALRAMFHDVQDRRRRRPGQVLPSALSRRPIFSAPAPPLW